MDDLKRITLPASAKSLIEDFFENRLEPNNRGAVSDWIDKIRANHRLGVPLPPTPSFQEIAKKDGGMPSGGGRGGKGGKKGAAPQGGKGWKGGSKGSSDARSLEMEKLERERQQYGGYTKDQWYSYKQEEEWKEKAERDRRDRERDQQKWEREQREKEREREQQQQKERPPPSVTCRTCEFGDTYYFCPKTGRPHPGRGKKSSVKFPILPTIEGLIFENLRPTEKYSQTELKEMFKA
eukprot:TRINITY_DN10812_c0_g2_i1.p1 TRINITY_DN10812_c0_g2~~TRINITY_DN10812_c0_g2_i1.p1  ORF type:complete len:237 (+),score=41.86 TRINITY_DN10812_c0_g2_i1:47-757(+)